ncbi:MAG TPA: DUF5916 domain-containing protein [Gemmatimonadales bacterium]|jgi:hypothetical protein|nr:DUF5916 domain-containing protein [Gemmatimonadales bacterium]
MLALAVAILLSQTQDAKNPASDPPPTGRAPSPTRTVATRAVRPPVIDGRDDDEVWRNATPITEFLEFDPHEGKAPRFKTEARVAYDARNFYALVRAYDPEPQKILKLLARRDIRTASDQIKIVIDSYHDRRSGYEFAVNPAGVKRDYAIYNDNNEDDAWDGVWEAKTTVDSLGWTAEFRIPLSQLRYTPGESNTFGFAVWRDIDRFKERVSWPLYRNSQAGFVSQLGEVAGLTGLASPRRLEMSPYVVTKNITLAKGNDAYDHPQRLTGGLDFKYGVSSNLTVDGTINPDFGQVEADPAVLNLSAFETFFQERRPFFIEGAGLLSFAVNCYIVRDCGTENLFYSRRIGRSPQLRDDQDAAAPTGTTIFGAAKLTGRTPGGLALGAIEAVTAGEEGTNGQTIEPRSNYAVVRATQDFRKGQTGIGVIGTMVNRSLDQWTTSSLRSGALVGGVDLRHRFLKSRFEVAGRVVGSRVTGSPEAIAATQQTSVHYFQRPDSPLEYDPTRTSLHGDAEEITFGKVGGGLIRFETSYQRVSPGFEANDLGFLRRADWQDEATWASLNFNKPGPFFRRLFWNFNEWNDWTIDGLALEHAVNSNVHFELPNSFWIHAGGSWGGLGTTYCDRCARGGPALRQDKYIAPWFGVQGDSRWVVVPSVWMNYVRKDGGRSRELNLSPGIDLRVSTRWTSSFGFNYDWNRDDRQWYGNFTDPADVTHYTFAHLEQRTASLTARINYTASPTLTVQVYAQPFVSKGRFSDIRELATPRAAAYSDRFQAYGDTAVTNRPAEFNVKQFNSNLVVRWEYRPGSALFFVWQQGRQDREPQYGNRSLGRDFDRLFSAHPDNTFLVKASYWLNR